MKTGLSLAQGIGFSRLLITFLIVISVCGFMGCPGLILGPDPENTPEVNFETLWRDFDQLYSLFPVKGINWDSVYMVYRPLVSRTSSDLALSTIFKNMLSLLNDGHVYLITPFERFISNSVRQESRPANFSFGDLLLTYFGNRISKAGDNRFWYGKLSDSIGYLYITTFEDKDFGRVDDWVVGIDQVLQDLSGVKGIVLDLRDNGGGDAFNGVAIAGRFADTKRLFAYGYSRNGSRHNDYSEPYAWYTEPTGNRQFVGPIAVLTNKRTASAAERFVLSMKVLPHVITIGDTTEGAFPHSVPREMPNGWAYRVTVGVVVDKDFNSYEGVGIPPDIQINITPSDSANRKDTILEGAIAELKSRISS